ncbi:MAG: hypothetical protein AAGU32_02060 [Bacillota bacterium]
MTEQCRNGPDRLKVIRPVLWDRSKTLKWAAMASRRILRITMLKRHIG